MFDTPDGKEPWYHLAGCLVFLAVVVSLAFWVVS